MRIPKALWIGVPAIFIFACALVFLGPGPKAKPKIHVRSIVVKADRLDPDDIARAHDKIHEIYASLEEGADFSELAREQSESDNAQQDGDMGWWGRGTLPSHHEDAVFYLEPGHYTEIIEDVTLENVMFRILYVEERRNF
jgi:parvulin-like peptidyl-prolyl isomerase